MLDKRIPYKNIIMRMEAEQVLALPQPLLPHGYAFRSFKPGDEHHWARIETSVLEFDHSDEALSYFTRDYLPYLDDLRQRCFFIEDRCGGPVATATAWQANSRLGYQASLHWVSVSPDHQGLGLGKAVVLKAMSFFRQQEPGQPVWLHTQTWSHVAVRLYHSLGFNMLKTGQTAVVTHSAEGVKISPNDYHEALQVLASIMDEAFLTRLRQTAR